MTQIKENNSSSVAILTSNKNMTSFCFDDQTIRFRTPDRLIRYTAVKEWDHGYIVVMAEYDGIGEVEEYIDLIPILKNLCIDENMFLEPIKNVEVKYEN